MFYCMLRGGADTKRSPWQSSSTLHVTFLLLTRFSSAQLGWLRVRRLYPRGLYPRGVFPLVPPDLHVMELRYPKVFSVIRFRVMGRSGRCCRGSRSGCGQERPVGWFYGRKVFRLSRRIQPLLQSDWLVVEWCRWHHCCTACGQGRTQSNLRTYLIRTPSCSPPLSERSHLK